MNTQQTLLVKTRIAELSQALATTGLVATTLRDVLTTLKSYPECVTILEPEEVATIVRAAEKQTQTHVLQSAIKSKSTKSKTVSEEDLF